MMGTIPSCEAILLEIQQAFGVNFWQTMEKRRFANLEMKIFKHHEMGVEVIKSVVDALDLGQELEKDLILAARGIFQFHSCVENEARTFGADLAQVAWYLLAYQAVPGVARTYGFWSLSDPVAPDMPGGDLWFVPRPSSADLTRLRLPVQTATDWWLDLLKCPLEAIWENDKNADTRIRNLQNWKVGMLPTPASIGSAFDTGQTFRYHGTFPDRPTDAPEIRFQHALEFVATRKGLDAGALAREIPAVPALIFEAVLSGTADAGEKEAFVAAVAKRWREPSNDSVRRRFLLARAIQDCHTRLAKLISPNGKPEVADVADNKVLQLWTLFEETHRLTVKAGPAYPSEDASNARFAELVPNWLAAGPLKSIMSVHLGAPEEFARFLTDLFRELGNGISDLFKNGKLAEGPVDHAVDKEALATRQEMEGLLVRLLNAIEEGWSDEAARLLAEAERHPRRDEFTVDLHYMHGRHLLNDGDVHGAKERFDAAFNECGQGGIGTIRKCVANACLGMEMAFGSFDARAERYFRVIATSLDPSETVDLQPGEMNPAEILEILFRDTAVKTTEMFWESLYRPYPTSSVRLKRPAEMRFNELAQGLLGPMLEGDAKEVRRWTQTNRKLLTERIMDVHGDTFFALVLKMINTRENIGERVARLRNGLYMLAKELETKTLDTPDFKLQRPLMLAADQGDTKLVHILLNKDVEVDAQDIMGRTALHAAAAALSEECYLLVLNKGADPTKRTKGKNPVSALTSAVKFGLPDAVRATLKKWPDRFTREELEELMKMSQDIWKHYKAWRPQMKREGREIGPKGAYEVIADALETALRMKDPEKVRT